MKSIRRLYFYAVAAISIEVVLWGAIGLLRSIAATRDLANNASDLASALALILVGVPIFLIHWGWAQRASTRDPEEHDSSVRAIFLYGILLGTLVPAVQNSLALIDRAILTAAGLHPALAIIGGSQSWQDNLIAVAINLLIAAYFWDILKKNWRTLAENEPFSDIRRLARFIWMLYGLSMLVYGAQQALAYAFTAPSQVLGQAGREMAVNAVSLMLVGAPVWFFAWRFLQDGLSEASERESYLRLGILYLLSVGPFLVSLASSGNALYVVLLQIMGEGNPPQEFVRLLGGPISIGVPMIAVLSYYSGWLNRQIAFDENLPRREGKQRLYFYILSFFGLGASVFGMLSLLSVLIDLALGREYLSSSGFREPLSGALAALAVGLPVWLTTWRRVQAQSSANTDMGDHARRSVIRKSYLYLALFFAVIGGMVSAGFLAFDLVNAALGGENTSFWQDILNELSALAVFVILLVYHSLALRADQAARADALAEKQSKFRVAVFSKDQSFGAAVEAAFAKRAPDVRVVVLDAGEPVAESMAAEAVILPGALALDPPETLRSWLKCFSGIRLVVADGSAGALWLGSPVQAADAARSLAEGQDLRAQFFSRGPSAWTYVAYVFAGLFALQLFLMLLTLTISLLSGGI